MISQEKFLSSLTVLGHAYKDEPLLTIGALLGDYEREKSPFLRMLRLISIFQHCALFWRQQKQAAQMTLPVTRQRANAVLGGRGPMVPVTQRARSAAVSPSQTSVHSVQTAEFIRNQLVSTLEMDVVRQLCTTFQCSPNLLPNHLERRFEAVLTGYGRTKDQFLLGEKSLQYLDALATQQFRLVFRGGLAYAMVTEGLGVREVLADTSDHDWARASSSKKHRAWCYGYVFTGDAIYMADHSRQENRQGAFFHSSYLSGATVVCAGDISFLGGRLTSISNISGHYQPDDRQVALVLDYLKLKKVPLNDVLAVLYNNDIEANQQNGVMDDENLMNLSSKSPDNMFAPGPIAQGVGYAPQRNAQAWLKDPFSVVMG